MPEAEYKHIRVRNPEYFSAFRVIKKRSHLCASDQEKVRAKIGRKKALYTVGKFKRKYKDKAPKGKKGERLSWGLQKIMIKKQGGGKVGKKRKTYKKKSTAKKARKKGQYLYKVKGGWRIGTKKK